MVPEYERGFSRANDFTIYQMELEVPRKGFESFDFNGETFVNDARDRGRIWSSDRTIRNSCER